MLNNKGFSLVGALVAVSILGIATMGFMTLHRMQTDSGQKVSQDFSIYTTTEEARVMLANKGSCEKSLMNYNIKSNIQLTLKDQNGKIRFQPNQELPYNVTLKKISVSSKETSLNFHGPLNIELHFDRGGRTNSTAKKVLRVIATVKNDIIQDCVSYESEAIETSIHKTCEALGGKRNPDGTCEYKSNLQDTEFTKALEAKFKEFMCKTYSGNFNQNNFECLNAKMQCRSEQTNSTGRCRSGEVAMTGQCIYSNASGEIVSLSSAQYLNGNFSCYPQSGRQVRLEFNCCDLF